MQTYFFCVQLIQMAAYLDFAWRGRYSIIIISQANQAIFLYVQNYIHYTYLTCRSTRGGFKWISTYFHTCSKNIQQSLCLYVFESCNISQGYIYIKVPIQMKLNSKTTCPLSIMLFHTYIRTFCFILMFRSIQKNDKKSSRMRLIIYTK